MDFEQLRPIVLASGSPRRKSYLKRYGFQFQIITADIDEQVLDGEKPESYARRLSFEKARAVRNKCASDHIIIAADTIVVQGDKILGKPASSDDVLPVLRFLNGKKHQVITSYAILDNRNGEIIHKAVSTDVEFFDLPEEQLERYSQSAEPLDKAGSYSIQGVGTFMVKSITGSYNNVVGLPIEHIIQDLTEKNYIRF